MWCANFTLEVSYLVHNWRQRLNCRCMNYSTTVAILSTDSLPPWLQLGMMPWTDPLLISEVLDSEIISHLVLRRTEWWLWIYTDVHIRHENYLLRKAAKSLSLYSHMVYPCVVINLRATLACQDSDSVCNIEINGIYILEILLLEWLHAYFILFCLLCTASWQIWGEGVSF